MREDSKRLSRNTIESVGEKTGPFKLRNPILMKTPPLKTFAFSILFIFPLLISAQPPYIVAQSDYAGQNGNPGGAIIGAPYAQTFTPLQSGTLYTIGAGFYAPQTGLVPYYIFQFRDTTPAGLPGSQVIASVNASTAVLSQPANAWIDVTADFSSFGINLVAGHKYAFSVDEPGQVGVTTFNNFFWGFTGSGYAGGACYYFRLDGGPPSELLPGEDFLFTVTVVPEPTTLALALFSCACVWLRWRRKNLSPRLASH